MKCLEDEFISNEYSACVERYVFSIYETIIRAILICDAVSTGLYQNFKRKRKNEKNHSILLLLVYL